MRWVEGFHEFAGLISDALALARKRPAVISDIGGRFPLDQVADAGVWRSWQGTCASQRIADFEAPFTLFALAA